MLFTSQAATLQKYGVLILELVGFGLRISRFWGSLLIPCAQRNSPLAHLQQVIRAGGSLVTF